LQNFDYVAAHSVGEVVSLLAQNGKDAWILAGGTDLLVQLREGRKKAGLVIDIKRLPEANELRYDPAGGLILGAAVPCCRVCAEPEIAQAYPGLVDAVELIGGMQIQGRASVGGNLCNASPAGDAIPALIVHQAVCQVAGPGGLRELPVEQFCVAPGKNALRPGEFLVSLRIPPVGMNFGAGYLRFIPRKEMDIAVVGAGASVTLDEDHQRFSAARVALGAVAPTPLLVPEAGEFVVGKEVSAETVFEAARIAQSAARPISDMRGTAAQRSHLALVLAKRALNIAIERAKRKNNGKNCCSVHN
jgi:CO/xanthine dehydrogenase FAD-binding subunit